MSTVLITDTQDGTTVKRDEHGWYAIRTAKLLNVTGGPSAIVYNAIQDALLTANNYNFKQAHPTMTALFCTSVQGEAIDVDKVKITCEYRPYVMFYVASSTQIGLPSFGASVQGTQTNFDITGAVMVVKPSATSTSQTQQTGTANVDAALLVVSFKRRETNLPAIALSYINCINQYPHVISSMSFPALTLKLDRVQAEPCDNGTTNDFMVTYEFSFKPIIGVAPFTGVSPWAACIVFQDTQNGNVVPKDATTVANAGAAVYQVYNQVDFSTLLLW